MASITEKGLSGRIGPVVYYEMNGKQYARARPMYKKKRTRAARHPAASRFGICSEAASAAGHLLRSSLPFSFKVKSFNLLRGWLFKQYHLFHERSDWHLGQSFVPICQLNPAADLRDFLFVPMEISSTGSHMVQVHIPAFDPAKQIINPMRAASAQIRIILMGLVLEKGETFFREQSVPVVFNDGTVAATNLLFEDEQIQAGAVLMVAVSLSYYTSQQQMLKEDSCLPAGVVALGRGEGRETEKQRNRK